MSFPIPEFHFRNLIEVVIIAFVIYRLLLLIKDTSAINILQGVGVILVSLWICQLFNLDTLYWIFDKTIVMLLVAIPIVFQPELRKALGHLGRGEMLAQLISMKYQDYEYVIDCIIKTAVQLSQKKIGAIVVLEKETKLEEYAKTGTLLDALLTERLLYTIFYPYTPLHDGAVIIRERRIYAAGCYLPLSDNIEIDKDLGTRHRAAIGITERCDAIALVISEETGSISIASDGKIRYNLKEESLKKFLNSLYKPKIRRKTTFWQLFKANR